jgi:hypothetical protein
VVTPPRHHHHQQTGLSKQPNHHHHHHHHHDTPRSQTDYTTMTDLNTDLCSKHLMDFPLPHLLNDNDEADDDEELSHSIILTD